MPAALATRFDEMGEGVPAGRDAQLQWLRRAAGGAPEHMAGALLYRRNIHYPNAKVGGEMVLDFTELGYVVRVYGEVGIRQGLGTGYDKV